MPILPVKTSHVLGGITSNRVKSCPTAPLTASTLRELAQQSDEPFIVTSLRMIKRANLRPKLFMDNL